VYYAGFFTKERKSTEIVAEKIVRKSSKCQQKIAVCIRNKIWWLADL